MYMVYSGLSLHQTGSPKENTQDDQLCHLHRLGHCLPLGMILSFLSTCPSNVLHQCYVGKKQLDQGISLYKSAHPDSNDTFTINWLPFYLNPAASKVGVDKRSTYNAKFGEERTAMIFQRLTAVGKTVGINFNYGGKTGATRNSHRLIQLGRQKGEDVQTKIVEQLFAGYFENQQDITSQQFLQEAGVKAGLPEDEVRAWLDSDKGGKEVDAEVEQAQLTGVHGVPNFTLQGKYNLSGAQDSESFAKAFERVKAMEA